MAFRTATAEFASANLDLTINRAPTAVNDTATAATGIGGTASGNVLGNDSDPDGDTLVVTPFSGTGAHGNLIINADGSYNYSVTNLSGPTGSHCTTSSPMAFRTATAESLPLISTLRSIALQPQ